MAKARAVNPAFTLYDGQKLLPLVIAMALGSVTVASQTVAAEQVMTVEASASSVAAEDPLGPAATIAAKQSVTGTKTNTALEKTPQSLSVVTRQEMDLLQPFSVKEALGYTPGVVVSSRGSSSTYDFMIIRGFSSVGLNQNNYLDGMKLQGNFYNEAVIDPYMLERVEVLRGPTSVLYGKSNPGGIVQMVSKRPTRTPLHEVQFKMGSDNLMQTGFDFSDALDDSGEFSWRLTGVARSGNDQQQFARQKRFAIAPSFSWRPSENTWFTFLSEFQNDPATGYYGWLPKEGTVQPLPDGSRLPGDFNEGAPNNTYSRYQRMVGYSFAHSFNDTFTVRQNLRYIRLKTAQNSVYGTGICTDCAGIAPADQGHYLTRGTVVDRERLNAFTVDTQLQSNFFTDQVEHTLLAGVDFQRMSNDINATFGSAPPLDLYQPGYNDFAFVAASPYQLNRTKQTGFYVQDQAGWNRWVLTLGGRYDQARQQTTDRRDNGEIERNDHQFTWRGGINYVFDNGIAPYFSYSQSFEPAAFDLFSKPRASYAPSEGEQYEAGVKYIPQDRPITLTAAIYQLTKTNNLMADPNNPQGQVPAGEIRARGVELESKAAINQNINLIASYTYTDAQYTRDTLLKGKTPAQVPEHMAALWGDYTINSGAASGLTLGTGGRFTGSSYGNAANSFKVGSAAVWNAVVKYDLGRFGMSDSSVALNVNNILNREYVASCFETYGCFWGAGRQFVATATFRF